MLGHFELNNNCACAHGLPVLAMTADARSTPTAALAAAAKLFVAHQSTVHVGKSACVFLCVCVCVSVPLCLCLVMLD